jgi:hypothetical protein
MTKIKPLVYGAWAASLQFHQCQKNSKVVKRKLITNIQKHVYSILKGHDFWYSKVSTWDFDTVGPLSCLKNFAISVICLKLLEMYLNILSKVFLRRLKPFSNPC